MVETPTLMMLVRLLLRVTWLLLLLLLLAAAPAGSWEACTELLPLDLLQRALPPPGPEDTPTQVQIVQSRGSRGLRLVDAAVTALSFPASQIFIHCHMFPAEFSLVATFKAPRLREKENEFIFSIVEEGSDLVLLGLRMSRNRLQLMVRSSGSTGHSRLTFQEVGLDDNHWHTVALAVTGPYATLTVDCGLPVELKQLQPFPSSLSTAGSQVFVGSRGRPRSRYSGLLRQLLLLPGSDATPRLCPSEDPHLVDMSVPQVLRPGPVPVDPCGPAYRYEAETWVTLGTRPPCSAAKEGQLWFNALKKDLLVCSGRTGTWTSLLQKADRLDYVEDYQDLYTPSETFDVELFSIQSQGLFMAAANRDSRSGSGIYRWTDGSFQLYQNISTREARAWKHFTIDEEVFLAVANSREAEPQLSVIYRWQRRRRRFVQHQTLQTHSAVDWEAFSIQQQHFLVVANHRRANDSNHNIHSVLYWWNRTTELFEENQTLSTSGAYDVEFFSVGSFHFLAVANTFNGVSTLISSHIYVWSEGSFHLFQEIPTFGATDWESFQVDGRYFLVVANSQKVWQHGPSVYNINSTVYELNTLTRTFIPFQDLLTHSAVDWEFFTVGEGNFLVVANSHDGTSYSLNSVVYRLLLPVTH
ncbi:thrombospondin-type laminin G domain and EAR repeat-containing protein-like isoform X2 [Nelusetta ayraudi]|uniref:thrombospondin-type laminin G domain and EAR repeat-containing protein-like isoform X2 n=1 Tax=Nelusetta ayraudi TaxID=303726 RepID=UPI003F717F02